MAFLTSYLYSFMIMPITQRLAQGLVLFMLLGMITMTTASHAELSDRAKAIIAQRIESAAIVCAAGESCAKAHTALSATTEVKIGDRSADTVYKTFCAACHDTGAGGAAKIGETQKWAAKLAARTVNEIYQNALNGRNAMPARGTCQNCTDAEIKRTVDYILERSR